MQGSQLEWWRRHGWTVAILLSAVGIAFAIRTIWTYPIIQQFGPLFTYAGGSDSYYHSRVATYIITNHANLVYDPLIHFPVGGYNPREPLFDWMNAVLGLVFAPFFGGNAVVAGAWFLDLQGPLWAALEVVPVYLIGREVSSKRMGLIAAIIFPFLSANIDSSIFGYANYLSFYTFIILVTVYAYIRTVKAVGTRRWIANYRDPKQYVPGFRAFWRTERTAVKWAVFTGVSLGALALAWQGYTYAIVVIGIALVVTMIIERVRRVDSFGLYVTTAIVGLVGFPMAVPYYLVQHQFSAWFDLPLLLFFGTLALMLPFLLMRDIPWVFSIPALVGLVLAAAVFLFVVEPRYFVSIVTGQGYFVKNLIYSTVAEAQAPSIDQLVVGYGVVTFFLAFVGVALFVYALVRQRFKRQHIVFLIFAVLSIYLPISAAKFFLLGSPAFALLPAEAIERALDVGGYPTLRRTVASLSDRRSQFAAFRKAFKARHVLVFLLVVAVVLPNVWVGIDAGIPGNTKNGYSAQVYNTLPPSLRGNSTTANNYFGAAGTSLDTQNLYDSAGYSWLATQDTNSPAASRPAFVSWWDYGFQAIDQGQHPSVADNFQNGIDPAGQFLLAQNESNAIGVLATTLLQAEQLATGEKYLPPTLNTILANDGINLTRLHGYLANTSSDYALVVGNPARYLPVDPSTLTDDNAMYLVMSNFLATSLPLNGVAQVYNAIQAYTGWSIRYDMADSRLIPFSGQQTGIFYAPADLTGRVINSAGLPSSFFNVTVLGSNGQYYPLGQVPADVAPVNYYVNYFAPFYNSLIYRTYFGYNGTDIGLGVGIPGLLGSLQTGFPIEPGWMLQHFAVVYKTAYYCASQSQAATNPNCYVAMNQPSAESLANKTGGVANLGTGSYFNGGESMLAYYPGQTLLGTLQLPNGAPVGGDRVTVFDGWGIPHESVVTAADGSFSLVLPPGNDTLNVTTGALQGLSQQGEVVLKTIHLYVPPSVAYSYSAPSMPMTITVGGSTVSGFVYWNVGNGSAYEPATDPVVVGAQAVLWGPGNLTRITATTDASGSFVLTNVPPGVYTYDVIVGGHNYSQSSLTIQPPPARQQNSSVGLPATTVRGEVKGTSGSPAAGAVVSLSNASGTVVSYTTNSTGAFDLHSFPPGNYSLTAAIATQDLRSAAVPVTLASTGSSAVENLTLRPTSVVSVSVTVGGVPVAGVPVQFAPYAIFNNASESAIRLLELATGNGSSATTGVNGVASIALPYGNYSVSALGRVGSALYSGLGSVVASALAPTPSLSMGLSPAIRLTGPVSTVQGGSKSAVIAYAASGTPMYAWVSNGSYTFYLPRGIYSLLALQGANSSGSTYYAALGSVDLTSSASVPLNPGAAVPAAITVGKLSSAGTIFPATGATVNITAGRGGPGVSVLATSFGVANAYVPTRLPGPATGYCVSASAPGWVSATECGFSPSELTDLTTFPLVLENASVTVQTAGSAPAGTVRLNVTATSNTAVSRSLVGGPTFALALPPGSYTVSAWAPTGNTTTIYRSTQNVSVAIPVGAGAVSWSLLLLSQRNSTGTLTVPSGGTVAAVSVDLASARENLTVDGTAFTKGFRIAPGSYTAHATLAIGATSFTEVQPVTVSALGKVTPTIAISSPAVNLSVSLERSANTDLVTNTTATLVARGATLTVPVVDGAATVSVPAQSSWSAFANASTRELGAAGVYLASWSSAPGASCTAGSNTTPCAVTMVPTPQRVGLSGTLTASGVPGPLSGTVRFFAAGSTSPVAVVNATNGSFAVPLAPGIYSLYATAGGGSEPLAALLTVPVSLSSPGVVSVALLPAWTATLAVAGPTGGAPLRAPANVSVADSLGASVGFAGVSPGGSIQVALPVGAYTAHASSFGMPYGVPSYANATMTVQVIRGNVGATLSLAYAEVDRVSATVAGTSTATVTSPGTARFSFGMTASGNVPVTVHAVGSPASWTFAYSFTNATLTPGNAPYAATVTINVPAGASALEPTVVVELELGNGTVVGSFSVTVRVVATYGVLVTSAGAPTVGINSATVPFFLVNTGNTMERVALSVVDLPRLQSLGWTVGFVASSGKALNSSTVTLSPFQNATYGVSLTSSLAVYVAPGSLTVQASVVNESGAFQSSDELAVPIGTISFQSPNGSAPVTVTGPVIGSPPAATPDWLIPLLSFVPALALVFGVILYRWWRTRRWTRR
jgi:dolichyl-phosphooligosaccharide-protein glycotransferase